jgi:hypothetical protein
MRVFLRSLVACALIWPLIAHAQAPIGLAGISTIRPPSPLVERQLNTGVYSRPPTLPDKPSPLFGGNNAFTKLLKGLSGVRLPRF